MTTILDVRKFHLSNVEKGVDVIETSIDSDGQLPANKNVLHANYGNGYFADPRGVNALQYRPYGRNKQPNRFTGEFKPDDIESHPFNYKHNYDFDLQMKTVSAPTKIRDCNKPKNKIKRSSMIEGWRLSTQQGLKGYKYPTGPLNVPHAAPALDTTLDHATEVEKKTMEIVADKSKYGLQKTITNDLPPIHGEYTPGPTVKTLLKMGNVDMENTLIGPGIGRRGNPSMRSGRYAGRQSNWTGPVK